MKKLSALAFMAAAWCSAEEPSAGAFRALLPVLQHPRCMNCHSSGDAPRQTNDRHVHIMDVRRGPRGEGIGPVHCSSCHQDKNTPGPHAPPGAADWHLPPPETPMIWEGLRAKELCGLIKDPARNGHKSVAQIVEHMQSPLVRWGWQPGDGRDPVPMQFDAFLANVKQWAAGGAACPDD